MNKLLLLAVIVTGCCANPLGYGYGYRSAPAPAPAPAPVGASPYEFGFNIDDGKGSTQSRQESGDGSGNVQGEYTLGLFDGRRREVSYKAGSFGFSADIKTNEQGVDPDQDPADVRIEALPGGGGSGGGGSGGPPAPYSFDYNIDDIGGGHHRSESGDSSGRVTGEYGLRVDDGRVRRVSYVADGSGFKATVRSNEPGVDAEQDPADVVIEALPGKVHAGGYGGSGGSGGSGPRTPYNFEYDINGNGGAHGRAESGTAGGLVTGGYKIRIDDGRRRDVTYQAGSFGFKAKVRSNEPGVDASQDPADADFEGLPGHVSVPSGAGSNGGAANGGAGGGAGGAANGGAGGGAGGAANGGAGNGAGGAAAGGAPVSGQYEVVNGDGTRRIVSYVADNAGFRAKIRSNEVGVDTTMDTADAMFSALAPAPAPAPAPVYRRYRKSGYHQ